MNIFTLFEAHRNPIVGIAESLSRETEKATLPQRFVSRVCRLGAASLPFLLGVERILSGFRIRHMGKKAFRPLAGRGKELSVVILNWNGETVLPKCLTHLEKALSRVPGEHEIIVVDNNSHDGSVELLQREFPRVRVLRVSGNLGFSRGNNKGVKAARKDLVLLLNNDIFLEEDTLAGLLPHFDDERVFAASPKVTLENGELNEGHSWGEFREGMLYFHNERRDRRLEQVAKPAVTLYPIGACALMDRSLYLEMGGLDRMLSPFYWEDDDLGYRALKRGYRVIYDPTVRAVHMNAASSVRLPSSYLRAVKEKNMLLFLWKNLTHEPYQGEYLRTLKLRIELLVQKKDYISLFAYFLAFLQAGEMLRRRFSEAPCVQLSDKEALNLTQKERRSPARRSAKRHVLLVTPFSPFPLDNGGALRVYNLTRHLSDRFDFSLLTFGQGAPPPELKSLFRNIEIVEKKHAPVEWLLDSRMPRHYSFYLSLRMERALQEALEKWKPDLVQVEFPWMAYYGAFIHNHPTVFVEHDVGNMFYGKGFTRPEKGISTLFDPLRAINYERTFIKAFDRVITVTEKDREITERLFPGSAVTTIETGVDLKRFPYTYGGTEGKTLVYLGHYRHYPNEDAVVNFVDNIFPLIKEKEPETRLILVGSHPTRRINRLKVRDDVEVTGSVPDVSVYLKKGTVFIAPIRLGSGIKGKLLEAMAVGLPIVSTHLAATGLGVTDGKDMLLASTPEAFADSTVKLLSDADLRNGISRNARRLVEERFDWRVLSDRMEAVYRELM